MSSAITNRFRDLFLQQLKDEVEGNTIKYHVGLARGEDFTAPDPVSSQYAQSQIRHSLQSVKSLSNASFVVPTVTWTSDTFYEAYDDSNPVQTNFYVINQSNSIFICIEAGKFSDGTLQPSVIEPTTTALRSNGSSTGDGTTFATTDGYKWRFLYKMSNISYATYRTAAYTPVKQIGDAPLITEEIAQKLLQDSTGFAGEIIGLAIDSTGTGIPSVPNLTVLGNGSGAQFRCSVTDGKITRVQVDSSADGSYLHGIGYDYATVKASVGDAVLRPIFAPQGGIHADLVTTLKSRSLMLQTDFVGSENGTVINENDFNQIALFRDIRLQNDSAFTGATSIAAKHLAANVTNGQFDEDDIFSNDAGTAKGKVLWHDIANTKIYYWQDEETGFGNFSVGGTVSTPAPSSGVATITQVNNSPVNAYSGDIMYINNVSSIDRAPNQTEDIRIVIQLG
tara:strand:+ start:3714 stop:5066 length:1353 start_codon:yes stop_codon:yes gene_type:complete